MIINCICFGNVIKYFLYYKMLNRFILRQSPLEEGGWNRSVPNGLINENMNLDVE